MQVHTIKISNLSLLFLTIITLLFLCGCSTVSTTDKAFEPISTVSADKSIVYIYRPSREFNSAGWVELFLNDEKKFGLIDNSYGYIILNEGEYNIRAEGSMWGTNWWPSPAGATLSIAAGQIYYIRIVPLPPGSEVGKPSIYHGGILTATSQFSHYSQAQTEIILIEKEQALKEIADTIQVVQE